MENELLDKKQWLSLLAVCPLEPLEKGLSTLGTDRFYGPPGDLVATQLSVAKTEERNGDVYELV